MTFRLSGAFASLLIVLGSFATAFAAPPVFTKILDTSTAVPGGSGNFSFFGSDPAGSLIAPAYDGTSIVFTALDAQNKGGIYR